MAQRDQTPEHRMEEVPAHGPLLKKLALAQYAANTSASPSASPEREVRRRPDDELAAPPAKQMRLDPDLVKKPEEVKTEEHARRPFSITEDFITLFQKDALYRETLALRRDVTAAQQALDEERKRKEQAEASGAQLRCAWSQLQDDLRAIWQRAGAPTSPPTMVRGSTLFQQQLIAAAADDALLKDAAEKSKALLHEMDAFLKSPPTAETQQAETERQALQMANKELTERLLATETAYTLQDAKLKQAEEALAHSLRRIDRESSAAVAKVYASDMVHAASTSSSPATQPSAMPAMPLAHTRHASPMEEEKGQPSANASPSKEEKYKAQELQHDVEHWKSLATVRAGEVATYRQEKATLAAELQALQTQAAASAQQLGDHLVNEHPLVKQYLAALHVAQAQAEESSKATLAAQDALRTMQTDRLRFEEEYHLLVKQQKEKLDVEMNKVHSDLIRVRNDRDKVRRDLEALRKGNDAEEREKEDLKALLEAAKTSHALLLEQYRQLQKKVAANTVVFDDILAFMDRPTEDNSAVAHLEAQIKTLMTKLETGVQKDDASDVQALKNQLSVLEGADLRALQQLESISTAFSALQTQFKAQTDAMVEKEKHITKLLADKTRVEQRIALATNEKNAISNKMLGVNKEMTRLTAHCTELEQLKEKQSTQLRLMEEELNALRMVSAAHEKQAQSQTQLAMEVQAKLDRHSGKHTELVHQLNRLHQQMEEAVSASKSQEVEITNYKKRIEMLRSQVSTDPQDKLVREENKDLKTLLKCSACNVNFKDTIIIRCCHVFCKSCIDVRINTRQRKCPNCSESFSASDVKPI